MEIAVVGNENFVLGFRLAGIRKVYGVEREQIKEKLEELMKDENIGIIVMDNNDMVLLPPIFRKKLMESVEPVIISIGKVEEVELRERIKQAVGVDLWKG
ncbi:MAG: V-type ATP synthase subunit F [Candidatus Thermoplasmatota archaeon]